MPVLPPIRVLVVDDSMAVRKVLGDILADSPSIELAGTVSSGEIALVKIPQLKPDVVTLDIEMPGMSGLQALAQIRKLYPKLPVIMFSTLTEHGAAATLEALARARPTTPPSPLAVTVWPMPSSKSSANSSPRSPPCAPPRSVCRFPPFPPRLTGPSSGASISSPSALPPAGLTPWPKSSPFSAAIFPSP